MRQKGDHKHVYLERAVSIHLKRAVGVCVCVYVCVCVCPLGRRHTLGPSRVYFWFVFVAFSRFFFLYFPKEMAFGAQE